MKFFIHGVARFVQLFIVKRKTDIYRTGSKVFFAEAKATSFPVPFLCENAEERPWSELVTCHQILGGKLQLTLGRGGRGARVSCLKMLQLKLMNLCVFALFLLHKYIKEIQ